MRAFGARRTWRLNCQLSANLRPVPADGRPAPGFTLIEMLVVITILGILAAMLLLAVEAADNAAKVAKTKATISKINHFIMMRYDSYRTRRLTLNISSYVYNVSVSTSPSAPHASWYPLSRSAGSPTPTDMARARVNAIRDLMRMEMPDRWSDILNPPLVFDPGVTATSTTALSPAVTQRYLNAYNVAYHNDSTDTLQFPSAKLLYMIVMSDSEAAHQFAADEVGAVDPSGLPVFLDGWGNPIFFLRWPVGFLPSGPPKGVTGLAYTCDTDLQTNAMDPGLTTQYAAHDPFDPHAAFPDAYAVFPLIFSAGPDGYTDINMGNDTSGNFMAYPWAANGKNPGQLDGSGNFDPYQTDAGNHLAGQPSPGTGLHGKPALSVLSHYDNIHNQHMDSK